MVLLPLGVHKQLTGGTQNLKRQLPMNLWGLNFWLGATQKVYYWFGFAQVPKGWELLIYNIYLGLSLYILLIVFLLINRSKLHLANLLSWHQFVWTAKWLFILGHWAVRQLPISSTWLYSQWKSLLNPRKLQWEKNSFRRDTNS